MSAWKDKLLYVTLWLCIASVLSFCCYQFIGDLYDQRAAAPSTPPAEAARRGSEDSSTEVIIVINPVERQAKLVKIEHEYGRVMAALKSKTSNPLRPHTADNALLTGHYSSPRTAAARCADAL
jgi:hypothetical protein